MGLRQEQQPTTCQESSRTNLAKTSTKADSFNINWMSSICLSHTSHATIPLLDPSELHKAITGT